MLLGTSQGRIFTRTDVVETLCFGTTVSIILTVVGVMRI